MRGKLTKIQKHKNTKIQNNKNTKIRITKFKIQILWRGLQVEKEDSSQKHFTVFSNAVSNTTRCLTKIMNILVSFLPLVEDFQQHILKRLHNTQCQKEIGKNYIQESITPASTSLYDWVILIEQNKIHYFACS